MTSIIEKIQQLKKNKMLKKMASLEFEQARGRQHLDLLLATQDNLNTKVKDIMKKIRDMEEKRGEIEQSTHNVLQRKLEYHIVSTRIYEIPGIGKTLGDSIKRQIYQNSINDLRFASRLQGIGESKQYAINRWIRKYELEIPKLMKQDFPGKRELLLVSAKKIYILNEEIGKLQARKESLGKKLETINPWIEKFQAISREDFINARLDNQINNAEIDLFIKGIFGEWETMPDWFKDVLNEVNNV